MESSHQLQKQGSEGGQSPTQHKKRHTPRGSILKLQSSGLLGFEGLQHNPDHVKFDEEIIAEHDKDRGTRQKISEPKTPYEEAEIDEEMLADNQQSAGGDVEMRESPIPAKEVDEEIKKHLEEAERNKQLNA